MRTGVFQFAFFLMFLFGSQFSNAQACFYIESILVDACGDPEGLNEMVGIRTRTNPLNVNTLQVTWATGNNPWNGVVMNAQTAAIVATLNQQVQDAGGCGQILEPLNGIVPPNSKVILLTSYLMNPDFNSFGALAEDIYIIFNNSTVTTGHFANVGTGNRTVTISGSGCTRSLTYNRANLVGLDGATVYNLNDQGITYANSGCTAPVESLVFEAGDDANLCGSTSYQLQADINLVSNLQWTASAGSLSNATIANPVLTWPAGFTGNITLTLTGTNPCGEVLTDTLTVAIRDNQPAAIPADFAICSGETVPTLVTTLPDGTVGTWSPAVISTTQSGTYTFTPTDPNACVAPATLTVTVNTSLVPTFDFESTLTYCQNESAISLPTTSANGVAGTWLPASINTNQIGTTTYTFTPANLDCSAEYVLTVNVAQALVASFTLPTALCSTATVPALPTVSNEGVNGTWNPAVVSTLNTSYVFTPNADQCADSYTHTIAWNTATAPDFDATYTICATNTAFALPTTSPNGITGTWNPAVINLTAPTNYVFTPAAGQCALEQVVSVNPVAPIVTSLPDIHNQNWCAISHVSALTLPLISAEGIAGVWTPSQVTGPGIYTFTPNADQCATSVELHILDHITIADFPTELTLCPTDTNWPVLASTSPNGVIGYWTPAVLTPEVNTYSFTATDSCNEGMTLTVNWQTIQTPDFPVVHRSFCTGSAVDTNLPTVSPNGITGTWSPAVISTTQSNTYVFTPNAGQCAASFTLTVDVKPVIDLGFPTSLSYCTGDTPFVLPTVSPSGHAGTWSPAAIVDGVNANYVFTPVVSDTECLFPHTLSVQFTPLTIPYFEDLTYCQNQTPPALSTVSPNGVTGTWSPSAIVLNQNRTYTFTPTAGQCASPQTIQVNFIQVNAPDFEDLIEICPGAAVLLPNEAPNGVIGTWLPAQVDSNQDGNYTFTYGGGDCAQTFVLRVRIYDVPAVQLGTHRLCINPETQLPQASVTLQTGLSTATYLHTWYKDGQEFASNQSSIMVIEPGVYMVEYVHETTGCLGSASTTVTASTPMTVTATAGPIMELSQTITVQVTGGSGHFMYRLDEGPWQSSPVFTSVTQIGLHTVYVQDLEGCADQATQVVVLTYPPFFTPNEDGFNDYWNISNLPYPLESTISIFDRYGKLLVVISPNGPGWDGKFHGYDLPATDYWFKLDFIDFNLQPQTFRAHFSLKR